VPARLGRARRAPCPAGRAGGPARRPAVARPRPLRPDDQPLRLVRGGPGRPRRSALADRRPRRRPLNRMAAASRRVAVLDRPAAYLEAGAGRPVVLLHGAAGRGAVWRRQLDGLADVARLIAPDLPGHGDTAGPGCRRIDAYAAWVLALLDALGLGPVVLVGHSMGGAIALTVALQSPGRLAGLGLVATGARLRVLPRILELFGEGSSRGWNLISSLSYSPRTPAGTVTDAEQALRET